MEVLFHLSFVIIIVMFTFTHIINSAYDLIANYGCTSCMQYILKYGVNKTYNKLNTLLNYWIHYKCTQKTGNRVATVVKQMWQQGIKKIEFLTQLLLIIQ